MLHQKALVLNKSSRGFHSINCECIHQWLRFNLFALILKYGCKELLSCYFANASIANDKWNMRNQPIGNLWYSDRMPIYTCNTYQYAMQFAILFTNGTLIVFDFLQREIVHWRWNVPLGVLSLSMLALSMSWAKVLSVLFGVRTCQSHKRKYFKFIFWWEIYVLTWEMSIGIIHVWSNLERIYHYAYF